MDSTNAVSPTWHSWYKTENNGGTPPYDKLAYCWSGFDNPWLFSDRVERKNNPLPAGGKGTKIYGWCSNHIAGIDCAGFVLRCWGIGSYSTWMQLKDYSIGINPLNLKKGDWLCRVGKHQLLYESGSARFSNVFESSSYNHNPNNYPGVQHNYTRDIIIDSFYSIFPQFDNEDPFDGKILSDSSPWAPSLGIEISIIIYASGNVSEDGVNMSVNNIPINDSIELMNINDTSWQFIAYNFTIDSTNYANEYNVQVVARNDITGNR